MEDTRATSDADVIVVGTGNAGFCAAHSAAARGRSVIMLEVAAKDEAGGNSYFTAGATRIAHDGLDDILRLVVDDQRNPKSIVPPYTEDAFRADMHKVTEGRNDPILTDILVSESRSAVEWLVGLGLRYRLMYERQAYARKDGTNQFWGGLHIGNVDGGEGLIRDHLAVAEREGVPIRYGCRVAGLVTTDGAVSGVEYTTSDGGSGRLTAESVVIAAGGFEASADRRAKHLGSGWRYAKVRGTPYNTGDLLMAALAIGAAPGGDWSSCHSVQWDAHAEHNESNLELTNRFTRQSYPLGIVVNKRGVRFLDEGADFRNYTYAKYGRVILEQPDHIAWQIFDSTLRPMLRTEEYEMPGVSVIEAGSTEELARLAGIDIDQLALTVKEFNAGIAVDHPFNPSVKDGRRSDVEPPKSNWAAAIAEPPFYAYPVTCGITFTFGGLQTDSFGRVLRADGEAIGGLFACGEALGGLFSTNYPGGSGLTAGMVFGRRAGSIA